MKYFPVAIGTKVSHFVQIIILKLVITCTTTIVYVVYLAVWQIFIGLPNLNHAILIHTHEIYLPLHQIKMTPTLLFKQIAKYSTRQ